MDRAPADPARCALMLVMVGRGLVAIERELGELANDPSPIRTGGELARYMIELTDLCRRRDRLHLAAELLEAALRYHQESLHSAALEQWAM